MSQAVRLVKPYEGLEIYRGEKVIYGKFTSPHIVISTCRVNGGLREDLSHVANHQACEPKPCSEKRQGKCLAVRDPEGYHRLVCEYHGLPPEETALLGTAANMTLAGFATEVFPIPGTEESLLVFCVATAGVDADCQEPTVESGGAAGHDQVAGQHHVHAGTDRCAVHGRHGGQGGVGDA